MSDDRSDTFSNVVKLIAALAWPVIVLCILVRFSNPLSETASLLPDLVRHATKVTAGGVTLEINEQAQASGGVELAVALKGLSPQARKLLLQVGESYWTQWSPDGKRGYISGSSPEPLTELYQRKLMSFTDNPDQFDRFVRSLGTLSYDAEASILKLQPAKKLSTDQEKRLRAQQFHLSELGKRAYDIILDVVVRS